MRAGVVPRPWRAAPEVQQAEALQAREARQDAEQRGVVQVPRLPDADVQVQARQRGRDRQRRDRGADVRDPLAELSPQRARLLSLGTSPRQPSTSYERSQHEKRSVWRRGTSDSSWHMCAAPSSCRGHATEWRAPVSICGIAAAEG